MPEFVVCLDAKGMKDFTRREKIDVTELFSHLSAVKILSGDPNIAVSVECPDDQVDNLKTAVQGRCTVGPNRAFRTHI